MKFIDKLLKRHEPLIAVDIGSNAVKVAEFDVTGDRPVLLAAGVEYIEGEVFSNNIITETEAVAEAIRTVIEMNGIAEKRVVTAMPGPAVFTKKIKMAKASLSELAQNIEFEAASFIPHNIEDVHLDFHVIGPVGDNQVEVLVVAVKNEVLESFLDTLSFAGLDPAVVDVDYFALQNMYELGYKEYSLENAALVDVGFRYSSIDICSEGESLFTGDITAGVRDLSDALQAELEVNAEEALQLLFGNTAEHPKAQEAQPLIHQLIADAAQELNRQLSFFWNASGADEGIDRIFLAGGGSMLPGLSAALEEQTGVTTEVIDPLRGAEIGENMDSEHLAEIKPFLGVAVGLGIREVGDKIEPELE